MIVIISYAKWIAITRGALMKHFSQNISRNKRGRFACFTVLQRAVEGTEVRRGTEGYREYRGL
jgi:hypothetical protein